ncbi:MAG: hypothetical protein HY246_23225 [Proteobacteria bacterium]|nr:hypothetical protein [Pseudomonadota bacterium]
MTSTAPALAHGMRQRYDLPIPLSLYLTAAGVVVALSFALAAYFLRPTAPGRHGDDTQPGAPHGRVWTLQWPIALGRLLIVVLFTLVIAAGLFGRQHPFKNIAPIAFWIFGWVGLSILAAVIGDLWTLVNPWATLFRWSEALRDRLSPGSRRRHDHRYPGRVDAWPAVILFMVFVWGELLWDGSDRPRSLALALLIYSLLTWVGMAAFGCRVWQERAEIFSIAFGIFGRFAPLALRIENGSARWLLRPYAIGLLTREPLTPARVAFVLAMLATVTFDGFLETPAWAAILGGLASDEREAEIVATLALAAFPLLLAALYVGTIALSARAAGSRRALREIAGAFILTLVPIALAYHIAHNLGYLLLVGQYAIPIASDPFGYGWDLFGTTLYLVDLRVVDPRFIWYVAVGVIVLGHVIAVGLAHRTALDVFGDRQRAFVSQLPMLALMIAYTTMSLWILAQPITRSA